MNYGGTFDFIIKYELGVNMNNGWIWIMGEYELCVNMIYANIFQYYPF